MRHVTFNPLLFWIAPGLISCIFICYNVFSRQVSITFYIFEHYQLWMMDSKAQRVFFPKTPKLCVWHTEVRNCCHFKLVSHFQLWFPIWGALVNRLRSLAATVLMSADWTTTEGLLKKVNTAVNHMASGFTLLDDTLNKLFYSSLHSLKFCMKLLVAGLLLNRLSVFHLRCFMSFQSIYIYIYINNQFIT